MLATIALLSLSVGSTSARTVFDLNHGWEFVRVKASPNALQYPDAIPTTSWKLLSVSSQETSGDDGKASNAWDGNPKTFWHTRWTKNPASYPHELVIDLGKQVTAVAFRATPRQTGAQNGIPKQFEVYLSDSLMAWGSPAAKGEFPRSIMPIQVKFKNPKHGRYLRFIALSGYDQFCVLSEIGLARPINQEERKSWVSQYNIENVNLGNEKYDLTPVMLERTREDEFKRLESDRWEKVILPHTAHVEARDAKTAWQGVCYYQRNLPLLSTWKDKRVVLTLNGAMQVSDLWLNGTHIGGRHGGYLPVVIDLSDKLSWNHTNRLLVRLDCQDNPLVPPGKPYHDLDFSYYSGLYRDAFLTITRNIHITDPILANLSRSGGVYVTTPEVGSTRSTVEVRTHIVNEVDASSSKMRIIQSLLDTKGKVIAYDCQVQTVATKRSIQTLQSLVVTHPHLWSPDSPYLYRLVTTVQQGSTVLDRVETRVGIRSFRFTRNQGLLFNGKSLRLVGTNRHQETAYLGNALTRDMSYRDMVKIKQAGFNCVRLSHYPQDPAVMDACDELGILAIPATAGWQFVNHDERFMKRVDQDIHELVRWHRNHPSILMWEASLNETYAGPSIAKRWNQAAHDEFIGGNMFTVGDSGAGQPWDMAYNGWDDATHSRPQTAMPDKPGYIREYGDYEFGGESSTTRISRAKGESAELQAAWNFAWSHNLNAGHYPWTIGDGTWVMYDYNRGCSSILERSGIADNMRLPRFSYYYYESQRDPYAPGSHAMVFIANYWTPRRSPQKVVIFSNCDSVELRLNGKKVGEQEPDSGPDSPYGNYERGGRPWDGGNGQHVAHPAFTFNNLDYRPGVLEAFGKIRGKVVAKASVRTPGKPVALKLRVDLSGRPLKADGADAVFIYAEAVDKNGAKCSLYNGPVEFTTDSGTFIREKRVFAEAGIAAVLLKAGSHIGSIHITARTPNGCIGRTDVRALK